MALAWISMPVAVNGNLAQRRSDNVDCPTLRGLLTTDDGATAYVEWNGLATLRPADQAFDSVSVGGSARLRAFTCEATI